MDDPHIQPSPRALHGPIPDDDDPALTPAATEEPHPSSDQSFVSVFNWITRRFNKRTHHPDDTDAPRRRTSLAHYTRGLSVLIPLHKRADQRGKETATAAPTVQPESSVPETRESIAMTATPPSHTSPVLKPGPDYAKMGDSSSGRSGDPVVGRIGRVKSFMTQVNDLPWVAADRVTIDYYPGRSKKRPQVQPRPPQGPRHVRSWYSERTSGLLPFTVVPEGNHQLPLTSSLPTTPPVTAGHEDQSEGDSTLIQQPQGYVPAAAQQHLALQYPDSVVHA